MEIWKSLIGFEETHEVSNTGKVRSVDRVVPHRRCNMRLKGKELKLFINRAGYHIITINSNNKSKTFVIHRLVAIQFIPNPLNKSEVNHLDGNKTNNDVSNLEWVTSSENAIHAFNNGLRIGPVGARNGMAKLDKNKVIQIKELLSKGYTAKNISSQFGVDNSTISKINRGTAWSHVV